MKYKIIKTTYIHNILGDSHSLDVEQRSPEMKSINTMVCKILDLANLIYDLKSYNSDNK